jgi:3-dehydroquinate dehydratase/shikimate dehydrogenase
MLCIPIVATDNKSALRDIAEANELADAIELRLDYMMEPDVAALLQACSKPAIAACRPVIAGGRFRGSEEERIRILNRAIDAGAHYVDIEYEFAGAIKDRKRAMLIVSYHNHERTPADLELVYTRMLHARPDVVKIVTYTTNIVDNIKIFDLLQKATQPTIAFCSGSAGRISRVLAHKFGSEMTFAALSAEKRSADSQLTVWEMREIYDCTSLTPATELYGVLGGDVERSLSPVYHNTAFREMERSSVYLPFSVTDLAQFWESFSPLLSGLSVTIPYKESIVPFLDGLDATAKAVGAVNTVKKEEGRFIGYNVDYVGGLRALQRHGDIQGKRVVILGAGGLARTLGFALRQSNNHIIIVNRTLSRAEKLAKSISGETGNYDFLGTSDYDVLINATPVGRENPDDTLVPRKYLRPNLLVFDTVYQHETRLIREAREEGCKVVTGIDMFREQAHEQCHIWWPNVRVDKFRDRIEERFAERSKIYLELHGAT